ncbi:ATP-binding protein [Parasediminibacterium sp. JCM 36343]|uniref:PAS domain-containing sensor histidine kinase n=1 Tax=Parasediminibacterium sp. JCM 36343 TaxID=3374279 RepID=UPI00397D8AEC
MQKSISYNEERFRALFEYASDGILVTDAAGVILLVNPAAERLFGYAKDELLGNKVEMLIPQRIAGKHIQLREGFHRNPHARSMGTGRDLHGMKKDKTEFPVEVSLSPFTASEGNFVIAFIIDITLRKGFETDIQRQKQELEKLALELEKRVKDRTMILEEALQQLEKSREELSAALEKEKEVNEMKSKFVSMASHEFRTPLATILSSLNLVSRYSEMDDKTNEQRHILRIKKSINHLTDLLNDVLSISKLEEGKTVCSPSLFDIASFTSQLILELEEASQNNRIVYTHHGEAEVLLDDKFLRIILLNLISNAIKFSPVGATVEVSTKVTETDIEIIVSDNGIGISTADVEHLFERFFRGNNAANIQGTGLGLNIVARYLELLGGTINVSSKLNEGTSFTVLLPKNIA